MSSLETLATVSKRAWQLQKGMEILTAGMKPHYTTLVQGDLQQLHLPSSELTTGARLVFFSLAASC